MFLGMNVEETKKSNVGTSVRRRNPTKVMMRKIFSTRPLTPVVAGMTTLLEILRGLLPIGCSVKRNCFAFFDCALADGRSLDIFYNFARSASR